MDQMACLLSCCNVVYSYAPPIVHAHPYQRLECSLPLPRRANFHLSGPATTVADTCIFYKAPGSVHNRDSEQKDHLVNIVSPSLYILQWVCEYHQDLSVAKEKAMLDMLIAQQQRRSLGLLDHIIFGTYVSTIGAVSVCASWRDDHNMVAFHTLAEMDLKDPLDTLRFCLYLKSVFNHIPEIAPDFQKPEPTTSNTPVAIAYPLLSVQMDLEAGRKP
ncbi:hypothetical protein BOTBODRAFT_53725 [Botryobasidium botryosum FD-172 SS1]|uniref:Uncharacterized protein n=1 Tax=Botryobasidium botryosum (strain FD-172 SS1) TaxID=930990 RepID=A0A067MLG1_BOTB1|nr:hypothetical protein BOTBODRAFT_53725 [Botryobasidium botryosum FD-172 SS1]